MQILSPQSRRVGGLLAALVAAALLAGCGLSNPNTAQLGTSTAPSSSSASIASTTTAPQSAAAVGGTTPQATIRQYAGLWCNWTTTDLLSHETQMAALSVGRARKQALLAAGTQAPPSSSVTNTCTIESIAPGRSLAAGRWVLVTAAQTADAANTLGHCALPRHLHHARPAQRPLLDRLVGAAVVTPTATTSAPLAWLRPCLLAYLATMATLLVVAGAVGAVAGVRDVAHVVVPFDWHRASPQRQRAQPRNRAEPVVSQRQAGRRAAGRGRRGAARRRPSAPRGRRPVSASSLPSM